MGFRRLVFPQGLTHRVTDCAFFLHEVFALSRSTKHMIQRHWGRLESTPSLQYRADKVMRHMPVIST